MVHTVKGLGNVERGDVQRAETGVPTPKNGVEKDGVVPATIDPTPERALQLV